MELSYILYLVDVIFFKKKMMLALEIGMLMART
jgi:hypothetical protein